MAVQRVLKMGEPLLRQVASPVTSFDAELAALVSDMDDTMRAASGAGIAAPQIAAGAGSAQLRVRRCAHRSADADARLTGLSGDCP